MEKQAFKLMCSIKVKNTETRSYVAEKKHKTEFVNK
jgi:hypothetical protein